MITILKKGTKKKIKCPNCGAVLKYEDEDVCEHMLALVYDIFIDEYITCPQCDHKITV